MQKLNLGVFGFGCVGQGLHFAFKQNSNVNTSLKKIVVKDKNKKRMLAAKYFSFDKKEILNDENINVVVELIDNANEAYEIVKEAIVNGKHVVTANKKMLATHLAELIALKNKHNVSLLYEAAACGSIPIIRTLENYFSNEDLIKISGIFNGTTNYILTKVIDEGLTYEQALQNAQQSGFAETDPTSDVEGFDALYKTIIIAMHGFGIILQVNDVFRFGISSLQFKDIDFAKRNGYKIKLVPTITKLSDNKINAFVMPQFVKSDNHLFKVENEFNGVLLESNTSGEQFLLGRGAGSLPTGAAVFSDIAALENNYSYENKKLQQSKLLFTNDFAVNVFISAKNKTDVEKITFEKTISFFEEDEYCYKTGLIKIEDLKQQVEKRKLRGNVFIAVID